MVVVKSEFKSISVFVGHDTGIECLFKGLNTKHVVCWSLDGEEITRGAEVIETNYSGLGRQQHIIISKEVYSPKFFEEKHKLKINDAQLRHSGMYSVTVYKQIENGTITEIIHEDVADVCVRHRHGDLYPIVAQAAPPVKEIFGTHNNAIEKQRYVDFLAELSGIYSGNKCQWLRLLLHDHLPVSVLSRKYIIARGLFKELDKRGEISYINVSLLSEIAELTKLKSAKPCVDEYSEGCTVDGAVLTSFRRALFKAVMEVAEGDDLQHLVDCYQLDHLKLTNIWDVVFYLETHKLLDNRQQTRQKFADLLNATAKRTFLGM